MNDFNIDDLNKAIESIESFKAELCSDIMIVGNKESFTKLRQADFPLDKFKHKEIHCDDSKLFLIPIPSIENNIKVCFDYDVNEV